MARTLTAEQLAAGIAKLALNYNRAFEDEEAVHAVFDMWWHQLSAVLPHDFEQAVRDILADPNVSYFPTVADMRQRVIHAARNRRAAAENTDARGTVACMRCLDSGWLDAGTDDDGYWWVRPCPEGCTPSAAHFAHHRTGRTRSKRTDGTQLALVSSETLEEAVAGTNRMVEGSGGQTDNDF